MRIEIHAAPVKRGLVSAAVSSGEGDSAAIAFCQPLGVFVHLLLHGDAVLKRRTMTIQFRVAKGREAIRSKSA